MNTHNNSPLVADGVAEKLRSHSAAAETEGKLTAGQLAMIHAHRWFKLFVPKELGGLELTVPEGVRLEEELARIDGSLGWTVTLCAGANLFVGYIDPAIAGRVFADPKVCLGGSGQPSGTATVKNGGYEVTGRWRYATGAPHNTHFTANCVIERDGKPVLNDNGEPLVKSFFFDAADVRVPGDWNTMGLRATASHSFEVDRLWVDQSRSFVILPECATSDLPLYRYPFLPFAQTTLAANTLGMARHFMECCTAIAVSGQQRGKASKALTELLDVGIQRIDRARQAFYETLDASWEDLIHKGNIPVMTLRTIDETSHALVGISQDVVVSLYPHCGIVAADTSSAINRIWRDIFTASQHSLFRR